MAPTTLENGDRMLDEIAVPRSTIGWVVVGRRAGRHEQPSLADAISALHSASLATLTVDLPAGIPAAGARVQNVAEDLRLNLAGGLPVAYLGAGSGAGAGWLAARSGQLDGVIAWNGRAAGAWRELRHVRVPSLLVLDDELRTLPWQLLVARALSWRLGGAADLELVQARGALDPTVLEGWYWERLLSPSPSLLPVRARNGSARRRVAGLGVAAALAVPPLAALTAASASAAPGLPNFAAGSQLAAHDIGGDSARHKLKLRLKDLGPTPAVNRLTAAEIRGDRTAGLIGLATGSDQLIDGSGVKYFINTNITFSTSSSASAAASEATYTHAVAASTLNGGTAQSRLTDSYDGYQSLCLSTDNTTGTCETGNAHWEIYNKNGAASVESNGRQIDFPTQTIGSLTVSRKVFVPSNDSFARWINTITNTGSSAATFTVATGNNLGSDTNTLITGDSSGNTTPTTSDTWVTTFQNFVSPSTTTSDPRLGHVFGSPGATTGLSAMFFQNGNDRPWWDYTVTLAPGQTRLIVNYGVVQPSKAAAATKSAELANMNDANQFDLMSDSEKAEVLNFAVPTGAVADSYSMPHDTAFSQAAPGVLGNDPAASDLTAVLVSGPTHAKSFTLNPDGSFSYTPAAGFAGSDSFTYESKGAGGGTSSPTTVTLTVVGQAPAITSGGSAPFTVAKTGSFTINTTGVPTSTLTESGSLPAGLTFKDNGDGTATISGTAAPGTHGNHSITVTAHNGQGQDAIQTLTLAVSPGAAPTAIAHTYRTRAGRRLVANAPGLLSGDTGESPLAAVLVSSPAHGVLTLAANGSFTYKPKAGFSGTDSFTYAAVDLDGGRSTAEAVTLHILTSGRLAQILKNIEGDVVHILGQYHTIVGDVGGTARAAAVTPGQLLQQAAKLARQAAALEKKAKREGVTLKALADANAARKNAAKARKLAAEARELAAGGTGP